MAGIINTDGKTCYKMTPSVAHLSEQSSAVLRLTLIIVSVSLTSIANYIMS